MVEYITTLKVFSRNSEELRTVELLIIDVLARAKVLCNDDLTFETSGISLHKATSAEE
jgi:hypothetical protein